MSESASKLRDDFITQINEFYTKKKTPKNEISTAAKKEERRSILEKDILEIDHLLQGNKIDMFSSNSSEQAFERYPIYQIFSIDKTYNDLLEKIQEEVWPLYKKTNHVPSVKDAPALKEMKKSIEADGLNFFIALISSLSKQSKKNCLKINRKCEGLFVKIFLQNFKASHIQSEEDLNKLFVLVITFRKACYEAKLVKTLTAAVTSILEKGVQLSETVKQCSEFIAYMHFCDNGYETKDVSNWLVISKLEASSAGLDTTKPWAQKIIKDIDELSGDIKDTWQCIIKHALTASGTRPTKKWLSVATELHNKSGAVNFTETVERWFSYLMENKPEDYPLEGELSETTIRGLMWFFFVEGATVPYGTIADVGEFSYRKIKWHGPQNLQVGNNAIRILSETCGINGVGYLISMRSRLVSHSGKQLITKHVNELASKYNISPADLKARSIPDFGLNEHGILEKTIGTYTAQLVMQESGKLTLSWVKQDGKPIKTVPAQIKEKHSDDLKQLKRLVKDADKMASSILKSIESEYFLRKSYPIDAWRNYFITNNFVANVVDGLIWIFESDYKSEIAVWHNRQLVNCSGDLIDASDFEAVRFWHPLDSSIEEVLAWREKLNDLDFVQPLKQAYREVYTITDAERETVSFSRRFGGHILKQHQFSALLKHREWDYELYGHSNAYLGISSTSINVEFEINEAGHDLSDSGVNLFVATGNLNFRDETGQVNMQDLDKVVFSEILRDVDLFVSVCSISSDPDWMNSPQYNTFYTYCEEQAFGALSETSKVRRSVLEALLPKLKINQQLELEERFIRVKGKLNSYRVHIGSSNIMKEPNNQYICIVAKPSAMANKIRLPFTGDATLGLVLSKLFLLAADDKITDPEIVSQIKN